MPSRVTIGAYRAASLLLSQETLVRSPAFRWLYFKYKRFVADPFARLPAYLPNIYSGGFIIDVGANIGYTSSVFQRYVDEERAIFAFEPESNNFSVLESLAKSWKNVECLQMAVGDACGELTLRRNPVHPGDHKVARGSNPRKDESLQPTERCSCTTLDAFLLSRGIEPSDVRFLKIDVQGFEPAVLSGAHALLQSARHLSIALEFDAPAIEAMGFRPQHLLDELRNFGFTAHRLHNSGMLEPLPAITPSTTCDILCLREEFFGNHKKRSSSDVGVAR